MTWHIWLALALGYMAGIFTFCLLAMAGREDDKQVARPCTCHPDDNPPRPCPQKFALSECRAASEDHNEN